MLKKNNSNQNTFVTHTLNPIYNEKSKILILGSFPSRKSRENNFYYGHPQNRFWNVISYICFKSNNQIKEQKLNQTSSIEEKTNLLLENNIALWDVIYSCTITGSSDSSIKNVTPVNIKNIFETANIKAVFTNGGLATKLYSKYLEPITKINPIQLPSTSPANARYSLKKLQQIWYKELSVFL
ncbi:MAG: DNA-deoxyinosine glycosylase [Treponema sp. CETP13]|nr:MAG: DNA-deoxyinosine glycosylase [Treponema sp. CETP13]